MRYIQQYSDGRATMVFCNTRKAAQQAAKHVAEEVRRLHANPFIQDGAHAARYACAKSMCVC